MRSSLTPARKSVAKAWVRETIGELYLAPQRGRSRLRCGRRVPGFQPSSHSPGGGPRRVARRLFKETRGADLHH